MRRPRRSGAVAALAALLALVAALGGCSSDVTTQVEALRIVTGGLPDAVKGEAYDEAVHVVGGLRPYDVSLVDGTLPDGIELVSGVLRGTPSATGTFTFTVQVADANLSKTVARYTLRVVEVPPPTLTLEVPQTEVQRRLTLRLGVGDARGLTGLRAALHWDPARFRLVGDSVRASRAGLALLQQAGEGTLEIAIAPLGRTLDGDAELAQFDLEPVAGASYLQVTGAAEFAGAAGHAYQEVREGRAPAATPGGTPGAGGAGAGTTDGDGALPGAPVGGNGKP